jgi:NADPH:quinone reductase-like Zn-dependent oxidoreductase
MRAAVVRAFGEPPRFEEFPDPVASGPDEVVVDVVASALAPRVRSQAAGSHYTSTDALPLVPGLDGVGRAPDGSLRYFLLPDTDRGALAERTVVDLRRSVALPDDADPVAIAAAANPAMSSWVALRRRIPFAAGQSVLVLGATGNAGRLAVAVARRLGAGRIVAAGRGPERMADLDADEVVALDGDALARAGADVDVVLDYLWGEPTAAALRAIVPARADDAQPLTWVQIGSVAGLESPIPSAALRAVPLQLVGSGQGSVPTRVIRDELGELALEIARGAFPVPTRTVSLSDVERAWTAPPSRERVVFLP